MNIFITGVSKGFGKELSLHYLGKGHKVFGISRSIPGDEFTGRDGFFFFRGSVNSADDIDAAIEEFLRKLNSADVLINNAAYKIFKLPDEITKEEYEESVNTNLLAPMLICNKFLPVFMKQKKGHIINISSNAGMTSYDTGSAYCSTKAGLISYSRCLSKFLRDKNITVNSISPPTFTTSDYRKNYPEIDHHKLLGSDKVIKVIDNIIFSKKFITGKNYPLFRLKTFLKYAFLKNIEIIKYMTGVRLK